MTNDLTTISGSLQEVIDRLENNLSDKGVNASFSSETGILGLVDEIQNIQTGGSDDGDVLMLVYNANSNLTFSTNYASDVHYETIDWGDGTIESFSERQFSLTHTYSSAGYYKIKFIGDITYLCGLSTVTNIVEVTIPSSVRSICDESEFLWNGRASFNICNLYWENPITYATDTIPANNNCRYTIPNGTFDNYVNAGYPSNKLIERD